MDSHPGYSPGHPEAGAPVGDRALRHAPLGLTAFVLLMAALVSINALGTDIMLPAFPEIGAALGARDTTDVQAVVAVYMAGFGIGQLFVGFLADRYGRRPVLVAGVAIYALAAGAIALSPDLATLLWLRAVQGLGGSVSRVVVTAVIRDCYEGRRMARVLSLVMIVFTVAPIVAPALGQLVLVIASWRWIFLVLALWGVGLLLLTLRSLPETLAPGERRPIRLASMRTALAAILSSRQTMGYTLASGTFFGALFGYISSVQQVMVDVLGLGLWFPAVFALTAASFAGASFLNAALVERHGMRLLSHIAVVAFTALSLAMVGFELAGRLDTVAFVVLMLFAMPLCGLTFGNFTALAMAPQGGHAGIASSVVGSVSTLVAAGLGYVIGQAFDGTALPLAIGFAFCGVATAAVVLVTERGAFFRAGKGV